MKFFQFLPFSLALSIVACTPNAKPTPPPTVPETATSKSSILLARVGKDDAGTWKNDSLTLTQWKGMYMLDNKGGKTLYQGAAMPAVASVDVEALLQGKWQSTEDAKSTFILKGKNLTNYYEGKKVK
jgi:hypothetical protein